MQQHWQTQWQTGWTDPVKTMSEKRDLDLQYQQNKYRSTWLTSFHILRWNSEQKPWRAAITHVPALLLAFLSSDWQRRFAKTIYGATHRTFLSADVASSCSIKSTIGGKNVAFYGYVSEKKMFSIFKIKGINAEQNNCVVWYCIIFSKVVHG